MINAPWNEVDYQCIDDYPDHDYDLIYDEPDGREWVCTRCGADLWEAEPDVE